MALDASLLLDPVGGDSGAGYSPAPALRPRSEVLLRRLRYSNLAVVCALLLPRSCDAALNKG